MTSPKHAVSAPTAEKREHRTTHHGTERSDPYFWMRADNWQEVMRDPGTLSTDIRNHLEAENTFQEAWMSDTVELQKVLVKEMRGRIKEDDSSVPMKDGEWAYGTSFDTGADYPKFIRKPAKGGEEEIVLDANKLADRLEYFRLGSAKHSPDHNLMIWSSDTNGSEKYTIKIKNIATEQEITSPIENTSGGGTWTKNSDGLVYSVLDDNHRPSKIYLRDFSSESTDPLLYEEKDPGFFAGFGKTSSRDWIIFSSGDHETSEAWLAPSDDPGKEPILVKARETGVEYSIDEGHGVLYILTNIDGAKDFKIMTAPVETPGQDHWQEYVAHEDGRLILGHSVYARHLVWIERRDGLPGIVIKRLSDGEKHTIRFDEEAYSLGLVGSLEFDTDVIRFSYQSMTTPTQIFDYNMETQERELLDTQEVPSGHDPQNYVTRRIFAKAEDGETIPVSILYHRNTKLDGTAPCLLYGYGSYGITIPARFSTNVLSIVDRGFVYAIAHIRGGKDKGFRWYEEGRREHKKNTFTDFIAAADHLIASKIVAPDKIVAQGGSAGGMLMGAVVNMRPDLFAGIIAQVPFVDVLNTMLDDTLPLTPMEWPEWGDPIRSKEDHDYILSYSPYDQVKSQDYPPILSMAGLTDPRVTYWEPTKWVARLRAMNTSDHPVLLRTNMGAGHGGASGRFKHLEEEAITDAFALKVTGKMETPPYSA